MHTDFIARSGTEDVIPQLLDLLMHPGVGALVDGDDVLRTLLRISRSLASVGFMIRFPVMHPLESWLI